MANKASFTVVHIPADQSAPLAEWSVEIPPGKEVECLVNRLKRHFAQFKPKDAARQKQAFAANLRQHMGEGQVLTDSMLGQLMQMGSMVDTVPLIYNTADVGHVGVSMYVDDQGASKELPTNMRASLIAQRCHCPTQVLGDAFLGRFFDNEDDFARRDFKLAECDGDAPWVQQAQVQARARAAKGGGGGGDQLKQLQAAMAAGGAPPEALAQAMSARTAGGGGAKAKGKAKGKGKAKAKGKNKGKVKAKNAAAGSGGGGPGAAGNKRSANAAVGDLPPEAAAFKQRGNAHFAAKQYSLAVEAYSQAIDAAEASATGAGASDADGASGGGVGGGGGGGDGSSGGSSSVHILYSNRSAAHLGAENAAAALTDAMRCIELEPTFTKGYFRAGKAALAAKRATDALSAADRGLALDPHNADMQQLRADARAAAGPEGEGVPFTLRSVGDRGDTEATFTVPPELSTLLAAKTVTANGGMFELKSDPARAGELRTTFYSPVPEETARAIATRIQARIADPNPPFASGKEECCVM